MVDYISFENRLIKNHKKLKNWIHKNSIEAYRIYDKDIPQFPLAIDIYGEHAHVQEYETGWIQTENEYENWMNQIIQIVSKTQKIIPEKIHIKKRQRQKGKQQYEKFSSFSNDFIIYEHGRAFWINLDNYLDAGLFLDHRPMRYFIGNQSTGKSFLNLFSYTGSFTLYAATGGAIYSESVDLSNTYLKWTERNMILNKIDLDAHQLIALDVFKYLENAIKDKKKFDLVVMDPPTFSNSKKMKGVLDIQVDHQYLIHQVMQLVKKDGLLMFSNNLRGFKLDANLLNQYNIQNISHTSIPEDFRNKKIHQSWWIKHL